LLSVAEDARKADQLQKEQGRGTGLAQTWKPKLVFFHHFLQWARCIRSSARQHLWELTIVSEIWGMKES